MTILVKPVTDCLTRVSSHRTFCEYEKVGGREFHQHNDAQLGSDMLVD